ncbi:sensor histidine kinase [Foetidibacter luteolus]|uniref:sensor histidine kinase n=1 Tax=Foetidibacter luteolus TaxID=2608880 RepID=UPI00129AA06F|nr:histidine kinase [Foetidibacter luteolus]
MAVKTYIAIIVSVLCGIIAAHAQLPDYHLQLFDNSYGIQPGNINAVVRDKKGFVWIMYRRQVQRFDGARIETFRPADVYEHIFCDRKGRVWLASSRKAFLFSEESGRFTEIALATKDNTVYAGVFLQGPSGQLWLLTNRGLYEYNETAQQFKLLPSALSVEPGYDTRTFSSFGNTVFFAKGDYIYRSVPGSGHADSLPAASVSKIYPINEDSALVYTWKTKSYWCNFKRNTITLALPQALPQTGEGYFNILHVAQVAPNRFFISCLQGIFEYNTATARFKKLDFFYNGNRVPTKGYCSYLYVDNDGYAWMATVDGLARFSVTDQGFGLVKIQHKDDEVPSTINTVRKITEDNHGNLWLATGYGLACWKNNRKDWFLLQPTPGSQDRLAYPSVRGLVYDGKYLIIGPTDLGIWLYHPESGAFKRPAYANKEVEKLSNGDFFDDIITLRNGNHLLMGRDNIYVMDGKTYRLRFLDVPFAKDNSNFGFQDKNGIVWITTNDGLYCLDSNLTYLHSVQLPFENKFISSGFILKDNRLLIGSNYGLYAVSYQNKNQSEIKKFSNLLDNHLIYTLYEDENGIVWATSENGIYRLNLSQNKLNLFDYTDNVQGYGFSSNSWYRAKDSVLFLGGARGLNYFNPASFSVKDELLNVYIRQARIGNHDSVIYYFDQKAVISYSQHALEVDLASALYNNPGKVMYRYRLEGLDKEWKNIGHSHLVRFSLPPGHYELKVQASLNQAVWVDAKNSFKFRILPPVWLSWWFISLECLLAGTCVWLIIRNRNKKIAGQQEKLETERAINHFATSMSSQQSVDEILWDVVRNCISRLQFEDCVIYLVDYDRDLLVQKAAHGPKSPGYQQIEQPIEIPLGMGITGTVAKTGRAEVITDTSKDARYIVDMERRYSEITVPIISAGKVLGVIDCEHSKKRFFTQKHLSILTTIASLCANKIVKARAEEEKEKAEAILMDTRQKMADAEMQALRAQMNPHFIFNCLNSINRYIVKSEQATASLYLTRFAKLIRLILDNSNSKVVNLANELEALRLYIQMESIRFEKQFTYNITVDKSVQVDTVYIPPLIIQPYVENAIWHGLLHKESAGELNISLRMKTSDMLECVIEDNGVGRKKTQELKSKSASKKSLGMKLTENRLALLNKEAKLNATVMVEDLENFSGEAVGTKVILNIPVDGD